MTRRGVLIPAAVAVGVALATFLYLAASPRWHVIWSGPYEIGDTEASLFTWLRHDLALPAEERASPGYRALAARNRMETWRVAGVAIAAGAGSVPVFLVLRLWWGAVAVIARPSKA